MKLADTTAPPSPFRFLPRREEEQHDAMFGNRRYDLLEGRVKAQNKATMALISTTERQADIINDQKIRIEKLEKQVLRLSKLVDPDYLFGGKYYQE